MPHNISESELAKLSEEERAALEDDDNSGGDPPAGDEDHSSHHSVGMGSIDDNPDPDTPPKKPDEMKTVTGEPPITENAFPDEDDEPFAVPFKYDPGQFNLEAAEAQIKELDKQFQNGDIDLNDYNQARDKIREDITTHKVSEKISGQHSDQVAVAKWQATVDAFLDQDVNSIYKADEIKYIALDHMVKKLCRDPKLSNKSESWILREADRLVRISMGVVPARPGDPKQEALSRRRAESPPPSLAGIPPAAPNSDDNEFANLDALLDGTADGQAKYERAIAKMSKEEQDRYARS